ncbi:histidinol-phosphate transaminase [Desulfovibrio sp. OttesenSCG-928-G15]|nr:histidinol-phosphate transaminase [Desulfovibrio sp. OttesenSCG-928-G15]
MPSFPFPVRPEVLAFEPYSPGLSIDEIRAKYGLESVVKLASNENPLGTSPVVQKVIREYAAMAFRYAQSGNPRLVRAIADHLGVAPDLIVPGNGSDEVIDLLVRVVPTPGVHNIVASRPSFSMYRIQSRLCGVEFRQVPLNDDFSFDWQGLLQAVDEQTAMVFITTPDNPSGWCPSVAEVEAFATRLPPSCLLVVDEAYMDFCADSREHSLFERFAQFPNLVLLRTFSKSYGLAGIRLGYGIMPKPLADALRSVHMPFSINILAEAAGIAALADTAFYEQTMRTVREGRQYITEKLGAMGCRVFPSMANFVMFTLPDSCKKDALAVFEALLSRGMIIRPLKSYGLPEHLRVSIGSMDENSLFVRLLSEVLA